MVLQSSRSSMRSQARAGPRTLGGSSFSNKPPKATELLRQDDHYVRIYEPARPLTRAWQHSDLPVIARGIGIRVHYYEMIQPAASARSPTKLELARSHCGPGRPGELRFGLCKTPSGRSTFLTETRFSTTNAFRARAPPASRCWMPSHQGSYSRTRFKCTATSLPTSASWMRPTSMCFGAWICFSVPGQGHGQTHAAESLLEWNIPFIDVGMGVEVVDGSLLANARTTTAFGNAREPHLAPHPAGGRRRDDAYSKNIKLPTSMRWTPPWQS